MADEEAPDLASRLAALEATVQRLGRSTEGHAAWLADLQAATRSSEPQAAHLAELEAAVQRLGSASDGHSTWLEDLQRWVRSCVQGLASFGAQPLGGAIPGLSGTPDVAARLVDALEVFTVMSWIADAVVLDDGPLISVTIAARERPALLDEAIASVLRQSYAQFELVVIDNADGDEIAAVVDAIADPRVRRIESPSSGGAAAAFNLGLEAARGDVIVFLDDDNLMHPHWLRSVVWAFTTHPDRAVLYGARVIEDAASPDGEPSGGFPTLDFGRYDRRRLELANYIDRNTMAVRASLRDVRYDEQLANGIDWEHALRLFARSPPLVLPAIACYYRTLHPRRMSQRAGYREDLQRIRARAHRSRPLIVDVPDGELTAADLEALAAAGATVTAEAADLIVLGSAEHARVALAATGAPTEVPFAFRITASDPAATIAALREDPRCLAVLGDPADGGVPASALHEALRDGLTDWRHRRG